MGSYFTFILSWYIFARVNICDIMVKGKEIEMKKKKKVINCNYNNKIKNIF